MAKGQSAEGSKTGFTDRDAILSCWLWSRSRRHGAIRPAAARETSVELREPAGEASIFRLTRHGVHKHGPSHRKIAVANVAVCPMIEEVSSLDWRKGRTEARMKSVGPDRMTGDRRHGDLIGSHRCLHAGNSGQGAQTLKIVLAAGLDQRQRALRTRERPNGAMAGHVNRHEVRPLLQRSYARRVPVVNGVERIEEEIGSASRVIRRDPHIGV